MKDLDKFAYSVVCDWPKKIGFDPFYKGIDYSQVIRFYLWDKVGRAIRIKYNIDCNEMESYKKECFNYPLYYVPLISKGKYRYSIFERKKCIFAPYVVSSKFVRDVEASNKYKIVTNQNASHVKKTNILRATSSNYVGDWHTVLYDAVLKSCKELGVDFVLEDKQLLKKQIYGAVNITTIAELELLKCKPRAVFVHSDNHPPFINYVLVAKKLKIPTFTYQHGLDCEHYYLDDSYADYVALWSENRKERYLKQSKFKAKKYDVVGNINIVNPNVKTIPNRKDTILFVSRPHKSIKCYSPSRNHLEGKEIVDSILTYLLKNEEKKLIIKPHPLDDIELYRELIIAYKLNERVLISDKKLNELFLNVDVVVTEDTTAGAEAMYYKLPCVHAHFAKSKPVLPFKEYECALFGTNKEEIISCLNNAYNLTLEEQKKIIHNQERFVQEFMPTGNGSDLAKFIINNI